MKKRDNTIDFFRGIAALWIIVIHTVCKSGSSYVPTGVLTVALIIDVPLFIFISGMAYNHVNDFRKTIESLKKVYLNWLIFMALYWLFVLIFKRDYFSVRDILYSLFFNLSSKSVFYVIAESTWFLPMYFVVSILGSYLIDLATSKKMEIKNVLFVVFILYGIQLFCLGSSDLFVTEILQYLLIYLFGYFIYKNKYKVQTKALALGTVILVNLLMFVVDRGSFIGIPYYKFEFDMHYFLYSMISILVVVLIKDYIKVDKNNLLCKIGRMAIIYYFAQGISSSIMHYIVVYIKWHWALKLGIAIVINIILTVIIAIILQYVIKKIDGLLKQLKKISI